MYKAPRLFHELITVGSYVVTEKNHWKAGISHG